MRSRRNVKNTKRRSRNRKMTRRVKTKRGGMQRAVSAARSKLGTTYYYDFLPLFTQFNTRFGKVLTPEQKEVVLKGERYFRSVADFPVDGPLKASITELQKEFSSTEKNAEKALGLYNKILKTLEDVEKRQKENITQTPGRADNTFSSHLYANSPSSLFLQGKTYGSQSSPSSLSSPLSIIPTSLRYTHFNTPYKPNSTELTTPPRLRADEKGEQSFIGDNDLSIQGTQLFPNDENSTPINSPSGTPSAGLKKQQKGGPTVFSPMRPLPSL